MFKRKQPEPVGNVSAGKLATMLGFVSYGLGIAQILRPGAVNRLIGVPDHNPNHAMQRVIGIREIVSGSGILFGKNRSGWMWSRVAGDAMDISIVGGTFSARLGTRRRLICSLVGLAGLMVLDAMVAMRTRGT